MPSSGASAVLLNVTAVAPTTGTYVTVFPTDVERPVASNLNAAAGQVVPNMVISKIGADVPSRYRRYVSVSLSRSQLPLQLICT